MKFTKEQIETAVNVIEDYDKDRNPKSDMISIGYLIGHLKDRIKEQRKKIVVEIEYNGRPDMNLDKHIIEQRLQTMMFNIKVTELPEVFSREDMKLFAKYCVDKEWIYLDEALDNWLFERSKK